MNSSGRCQWKAVFRFHPHGIHEKSISETEGIEFDTEKTEGGICLKGFSLTTPHLTMKESLHFVWEKANRIFDYMSAIHNRSIEGRLDRIIRMGAEGEVRTGYVNCSADLILHRPVDLDFNKDSATSVLQNSDKQFMRQLSHFRRGLETNNTVTKVREFYLIIEDQYPPDHVFIQDYSYVRHLQNHPELTRSKHAKKAKKLIEKIHMDPSDPKDMEAIRKPLKEIETEAKRIINGKL